MASPLVRQMFGIDLRALAVLRIGLGVLMLVNLALRIPDFVAHYTDAGALPRSFLTSQGLYSLSGGIAWPAFLFVLTALVALALLVGYRTWLATVLCWFLLISLHHRHPHITNAGDHVLALMLFWSMFLPLGARASVDSRAARPHVKLSGSVLSVASIAILFQLFAIYFFSALLKSYFDWVVTGQALYFALQIDSLNTVFSEWLSNSPLPDKFASRATYWYELLGVFVAFIPWGNTTFRCLTVAGFVFFHLTLIASFEIMLFPYTCIVAWAIYLPPPFWDAVTRFRIPDAIDRRWDALLVAIAARVDALAARHQSWPVWPVDFQAGRVKQGLAGVILLFVVWDNVAEVSSVPMPSAVEWVGSQANVKQRWGMFAPYPTHDDGWWIAAATLGGGQEMDLFSGKPLDWRRPAAIRETYASHRWRKNLGQIWSMDDRRPLVEPLADWLRRDWDARHTSKVASLTVYFMLERTQPRPDPPIRRGVPIFAWDPETGGQHSDYNESRRAWARPAEGDELR